MFETYPNTFWKDHRKQIKVVVVNRAKGKGLQFNIYHSVKHTISQWQNVCFTNHFSLHDSCPLLYWGRYFMFFEVAGEGGATLFSWYIIHGSLLVHQSFLSLSWKALQQGTSQWSQRPTILASGYKTDCYNTAPVSTKTASGSMNHETITFFPPED